VLAVGSSIRGDDAAGLLAAGHLKDFARRSRGRVKIFLGETAPENLTGEIKRYQPAHLVVIDAMDTQAPPGELHMLEFHEREFSSLGPTSTHNLPLGILLKYLQAFLSCRITVIGIQPKSLGFNQPVTRPVGRAARLAADLFQQAVAAAT
jgi:hydrogenase 3 maturation protease